MTTILQNNWMQLLPKMDGEETGNRDETMVRLLEKMQGVKTGFQSKENWKDTFQIHIKVLAQKN